MSQYYLAGRYGRRDELKGYAHQLQSRGYGVTSRWLSCAHDALDDKTKDLSLQAIWAKEDVEDIDQADVLLAFTESPESGYSRGGRHIEVGYAIAKAIPIVVVGPIENIFYAWIASRTVHFDTFDEFINWEDGPTMHFRKRTGEPANV